MFFWTIIDLATLNLWPLIEGLPLKQKIVRVNSTFKLCSVKKVQNFASLSLILSFELVLNFFSFVA